METIEINKSLFLNGQNTDRKQESRMPPKQSFHQATASRSLLRPNQRKPSLFDMVAKKEKRDKKKELSPQVKEGGERPSPHEEVRQASFASTSGTTSSATYISALNAEITDFMEKMANFIVAESRNGITTTTVILEAKGSILNGTQIIMDHYDTAPHSFNLQLTGNPESIDLFTAHLAALQSSLETHRALQGFHIHILPPMLNGKSDLHLRGKEKKERIEGKEKGTRVASKKKISF